MTTNHTTLDEAHRPARRRRHARLIATLTDLISACAQAATAVYRPIADASPFQGDVSVNVFPCMQVALTAAELLDRARAEDDARWPAVVATETETARRTYAARVAVAAAQDATDPVGPADGKGVALPTPEQAAAMDIVSMGNEVARLWRDDPADGAAMILSLTQTGEVSVEELLDEAADVMVLAALLAFQQVGEAVSDPSLAAERCLTAVPHLVVAVTLASADLD